MTNYDDVAPTAGNPAQSHQYIFDIAVPPVAPAEPTWLNVPDITALNPEFAAQLQEITTYAHKGSKSQSKIGSDFTLSFNILKIRDLTGEFQPEWLALKEASDKDGSENYLMFRYYDALGASDAYEGIAAVARGGRPESASIGVGWDAFVLTGSGRVLPIENPVTGP